eukprot:51140-Chlamydomonas_euryale.AAC.1
MSHPLKAPPPPPLLCLLLPRYWELASFPRRIHRPQTHTFTHALTGTHGVVQTANPLLLYPLPQPCRRSCPRPHAPRHAQLAWALATLRVGAQLPSGFLNALAGATNEQVINGYGDAHSIALLAWALATMSEHARVEGITTVRATSPTPPSLPPPHPPKLFHTVIPPTNPSELPHTHPTCLVHQPWLKAHQAFAFTIIASLPSSDAAFCLRSFRPYIPLLRAPMPHLRAPA